MRHAFDESHSGWALCRPTSASGRLRIRAAICILAAAVAIISCCDTARASDPTLEDTTRALQEWKRSWVTLRFSYERRVPVQIRRWAKDPKIKNAESLDGYFWQVMWSFASDDSRRFEQLQFDDWELVETTVKSQRARDSHHFEAVSHRTSDGTDALSQLVLTTYNPPAPSDNPDYLKMGCFRNAEPIHALYNAVRSEWIGDSLAHGLGTLEAFEDIDGVRCARVRVDKVLIWFDPSHGFLPRRSDYLLKGGDEWSAMEYEQLANGTWFPKRGTFRSKADAADEIYHWKLIDVAVNEPLSPALFDPPTPVVGTVVHDYRKNEFYTVKDPHAGPPTLAQPDAVGTKIDPVPERSPVSAEISLWDRWQWPVMLLASAIVTLMTGIWLSRRT